MAENEKVAHKCVLCDTVLESKESLQEHFRKHANKEVDTQGVPGKTKVPARKPVKSRELTDFKKGKGKQIACDVCGQEFGNNTSAIQHKFRKHPDDTVKFICPYCGMQFTIKSIFDNHIGTHMSDLRKKESVPCEECGVEFYFKEAKDYHFNLTHKRLLTLLQPVPTPPPSKKIKINNAGEIQSVYYCHLCGCEYMVKFNLQNHLEKGHSEHERTTLPTDLIRCTKCDALFYNKKAYEIHNINHRPDDLYVTSEEQRLQTVSRVDQDFDIRRVLPLAEKYLPTYKNKPKLSSKTCDGPQIKKEIKEEDLSPPSTPESSDSGSSSDSDVPLAKLKEKTGPGDLIVKREVRET